MPTRHDLDSQVPPLSPRPMPTKPTVHQRDLKAASSLIKLHNRYLESDYCEDPKIKPLSDKELIKLRSFLTTMTRFIYGTDSLTSETYYNMARNITATLKRRRNAARRAALKNRPS